MGNSSMEATLLALTTLYLLTTMGLQTEARPTYVHARPPPPSDPHPPSNTPPCQGGLRQQIEDCLEGYEVQLIKYRRPEMSERRKMDMVGLLCHEYEETLQCLHVALLRCPPSDSHLRLIQHRLGGVRGFMDTTCYVDPEAMTPRVTPKPVRATVSSTTMATKTTASATMATKTTGSTTTSATLPTKTISTTTMATKTTTTGTPTRSTMATKTTSTTTRSGVATKTTTTPKTTTTQSLGHFTSKSTQIENVDLELNTATLGSKSGSDNDNANAITTANTNENMEFTSDSLQQESATIRTSMDVDITDRKDSKSVDTTEEHTTAVPEHITGGSMKVVPPTPRASSVPTPQAGYQRSPVDINMGKVMGLKARLLQRGSSDQRDNSEQSSSDNTQGDIAEIKCDIKSGFGCAQQIMVNSATTGQMSLTLAFVCLAFHRLLLQ